MDHKAPHWQHDDDGDDDDDDDDEGGGGGGGDHHHRHYDDNEILQNLLLYTLGNISEIQIMGISCTVGIAYSWKHNQEYKYCSAQRHI